MKRILIVGGSGFIGTHLTARLLALGHRVRIFDKADSAAYPQLVTIGDVRDANALAAAVNDNDCIISLAAEHRDDVKPRSLYFEVNVGGAENLVRAAAASAVPRLIFLSTVALYGLDQTEADEGTPLRPYNAYGQSKVAAEKVYMCWADAASARSLLVLRPVVVFGEGNYGNVYNLIEQIRRRRFVRIGAGHNRKSMAYVGNLVEFIVRHIDGTPGVQLFNYSDPPDKTMREFVDLIRTQLGHSAPTASAPYWLGLAAGYVGDVLAMVLRRPFVISSLRVRKFAAATQVSSARLDATGFVRPYTIEEGLARTLADLRICKTSRDPDRAA